MSIWCTFSSLERLRVCQDGRYDQCSGERAMMSINCFAFALTERLSVASRGPAMESEGGVEGMGAYLNTKFITQTGVEIVFRPAAGALS